MAQVRAHAVVVLARADDEELCQYLLQLVQARSGALLSISDIAARPCVAALWRRITVVMHECGTY